MNIKKLSLNYEVRKLKENDIHSIYNLSIQNPLFYKYCPPYVTKESIQDDMNAMPPGKDDKYYIGYFDKNELVAVMDLISGYPDKQTAFIGLFMMSKKYQGKGIGSNLIEEACEYLRTINFKHIRLAFAKGNKESESFWLKNKFIKTGDEFQKEGYIAVVMQKELSD